MSDAASTARKRIKHFYLLVVHDPSLASEHLHGVCYRLRKEYVVRTYTTAFDAIAALAVRSHACVVCYVGGRVQAGDFRSLVTAVAPSNAVRIVFIATSAATAADFECLEKMGRHWLDESATPEEIASLVRAVSE